MNIEKVKQAALNNFAEYGYEEASLSMIAGELGIRKQSLATYFKSKEDLLFAVFDDEYKQQITCVDEIFSQDMPTEKILFTFLDSYRKRYAQTSGVKFWLRMTLFEKISKDKRAWPKVYQYLDHLRDKVQNLFPDDRYAADAYLGVYDSLCVELLFGGYEKAEKRLEASWNVYWRGVNSKEGSNE